jgi:hypothetical protein
LSKTVLIFLVLWLLTTLYVALFPTHHFTLDAVNNLLFIEQQNRYELWHPQHLLGQWPGYWTYQLAGGTLRAWEAMRLANALLSGATVSLVYAAVLTLTRSFRIAVVSGLCLWLSYGFWHYQSDPDVYSIGYATVALLLLAYTRYLDAPSTRRAWLLALAAAFAILMHQLNLELAGLIGLSLIYLARQNASWKTVVFYALVCAVVPLAVYLVGWRSAGDYLGESAPGFVEWLAGYFGRGRTGGATWGASLGVSTLPIAAYTFLLSWVLPPLLDTLSVVEIALLGLLGIAFTGLLLHMLVVLRRLTMPHRLVAWVCALTLLTNGVSGWWWMPGSMKFYLFMQIPLIILVALYAHQALTAWQRHLRRLVLGLLLSLLTLFQFALTLPYQARGGVFTVAELARDESVIVWFDDVNHADIFYYLTGQPRRVLRGDFCQTAPTTESMWWVVREDVSCPALASAQEVGRYQADRSRTFWVIYELS